MTLSLFLAAMAAGFADVISPGPAFLAVFGLAAAQGRRRALVPGGHAPANNRPATGR